MENENWAKARQSSLQEKEKLSISRKALEISERDNEIADEALSNSRKAALSSERATRVAIMAIILSIIMAIKEFI